LNDINTADFETGVEDLTKVQHGPVLPDRLTENYHKTVDHPTFFAKGTDVDDTTQGGGYFTAKPKSSDAAEQAVEEYYQPPAGWHFERNANNAPDHSLPNDTVTQPQPPITTIGRNLGDDSELKYIPREEFYGAKEGYVFRLGSKGIGYYEDITK